VGPRGMRFRVGKIAFPQSGFCWAAHSLFSTDYIAPAAIE